MTDQTAADVQFGRQFVLVRNGAVIADGVEFPDGHVAIHWTGAKWPTLTPHETMDAAIVAHSQNGAVRVVWQLTGIPQAEYGSVWPELVGWAQAAQEDGEQIDPAQLLEYMRELKQRALAPVRQWMDSVRGAAAQSSSPHRPPCVDGDHCGEAAHCPPIVSATEDAARQAAAQPAAACPSCKASIEHTEHCPTPETHNWGCGCPTDQHPAAGLAAPTNHNTETEARERIELMVRTNAGSMTVWTPDEVRSAIDGYRAAILHRAAERIRAGATDGDFNAPEYGSHENVLEAADLIDPPTAGAES